MKNILFLSKVNWKLHMRYFQRLFLNLACLNEMKKAINLVEDKAELDKNSRTGVLSK